MQEPGSALALTLNLSAYNDLPNDLKHIIKNAAENEAFRMLSEMTAGNAMALQVLLNKHKVKVRTFPDDVMEAMFKAAKEMMEEMKNKDEFTKKVYNNWSVFRKKIIQLSPMTELGYMSLREKFREII